MDVEFISKLVIVDKKNFSLLDKLERAERRKIKCRFNLDQIVDDEIIAYVFDDSDKSLKKALKQLEIAIANEYSVLSKLYNRGLEFSSIRDALNFYDSVRALHVVRGSKSTCGE